MGKQWARQEAKKEIVADSVTKATSWLTVHREKAMAAGGAVVAVAIGAAWVLHSIDKNRETAWEQLAFAESAFYQGQPDKALDMAKTLESQYAQTTAAGFSTLFVGDVLFRGNKYKEAADTYRRLIDRQSPKAAVPIALNDLAMAQEAAGDCKSAIDTAQEFLKDYQDHFLAPQVHASLARCQEALGMKDQAKTTYERMVVLYPESYWAQWAKAHKS